MVKRTIKSEEKAANRFWSDNCLIFIYDPIIKKGILKKSKQIIQIMVMIINKKIAVSETGFVFNPTTGDSYSMNPIASEILEMLKKDMSEEDIKKSLFDKYDVSKSVLNKSYDEFIDTLKKLNIIEED